MPKRIGVSLISNDLLRKNAKSKLAERVGFEPTVRFPVHTLSKRAPSTTRTSLRFRINSLRAVQSQIIARRRRIHRSSTSPLNPTDYGGGTAAPARKLCLTP